MKKEDLIGLAMAAFFFWMVYRDEKTATKMLDKLIDKMKDSQRKDGALSDTTIDDVLKGK